MKKYVITISIIAIIILVLFGSYYIYSSNNSGNNVDTLKNKADEEISYLNTTIISMLNQLNNITYANYEIVEEEISVEQSDSQSSSSSSSSSSGSSGGQQGSGESSGQGQGQSQSQTSTITNINMNDSSILVNTNKKIDWDNIKKETEKMYATWTTILIDLNALNINQDNLKQYSQILDDVTKAVQKEDKKATASELANLYSLIASYTKDYSSDTKKINILATKSNILYAYALVEDDKWEDMKKYIQNAQVSYNNIINGSIQNTDDINSINKSYILLNELEKSTNTQDKSIFYINYKNLMQELEILEK